MIVTVTPNPAVDLTVHLDRFEPGETQVATSSASRAGGKGLNVARVLHGEGLDVLAVTTAGGATGDELANDLATSGVPHRIAAVSVATRRTIAIVEDTGETSLISESGVAPNEAEWAEFRRIITGSLVGAACVVGSGSLPAGSSPEFYAWLTERAREAGASVVIDAAGAALLAAAAARPDLMKPNLRELAGATGERDPVLAAQRLLELGADTVVVSLGAAGMIAVTSREPGRIWRAGIPDPLAGNATGAGDAAVAAAAHCLANGIRDPAEILRLAVEWSAAAVLMPLAGELASDRTSIRDSVVVDVPASDRSADQEE